MKGQIEGMGGPGYLVEARAMEAPGDLLPDGSAQWILTDAG